MFSLVCTEGGTSNFDDWNVAEFVTKIRVFMETLSKSPRNIFEDPLFTGVSQPHGESLADGVLSIRLHGVLGLEAKACRGAQGLDLRA